MIERSHLLSVFTRAFERHTRVVVTTRVGARLTGFVAYIPSDWPPNTCVLTATSDYAQTTHRVVLELSEVVAVETWAQS